MPHSVKGIDGFGLNTTLANSEPILIGFEAIYSQNRLYPSFPPDRSVRRSDCILTIFNKNSVQFKYIFCLLLFSICGHRYARYGMKTNQKSLLLRSSSLAFNDSH